MKLAAIAVAALALTGFAGGALADATTPPVTMQPIPNPPEAPKPMKHHKKAEAPKAPDAK